jgi:hypothetical protein
VRHCIATTSHSGLVNSDSLDHVHVTGDNEGGGVEATNKGKVPWLGSPCLDTAPFLQINSRRGGCWIGRSAPSCRPHSEGPRPSP